MEHASVGFLAAVGIRTAVILVALVVGVRLFGRRQIGELNLADLLVVLMAANAVQNAMTSGNGGIATAVVSAGVLLLIGRLAVELIVRRPSLQHRLTGAPTVLVLDGRLLQKNVRHEHLNADDVLVAVRQQGLSDLGDVRLAILESDGSISVVPAEGQALSTP